MQKNALIFAPLEGITDAEYREVVAELAPEWDYFFTDFFRVPSADKIPSKCLLEHFSNALYHRPQLRAKTVFQLLAAPNSNCLSAVKILNDLDIPWIDLNAGCPSRKVNAHCGGAWLMSEPKELQKIIQVLRKNFSKRLSVKIRSGYRDTNQFDEVLKIIQGEGVDLLTVHPRTRDQLYQGTANWDFITQAVQKLSIPVIGNGDLLSTEDMQRMLDQTGCHALMVGRAAVGDPSMAAKFKMIASPLTSYHYLNCYAQKLLEGGRSHETVLKRLKGISNFMPFERSQLSPMLRTLDFNHFFELLLELESKPL